jgi:hypothetical protein
MVLCRPIWAQSRRKQKKANELDANLKHSIPLVAQLLGPSNTEKADC